VFHDVEQRPGFLWSSGLAVVVEAGVRPKLTPGVDGWATGPATRTV
jgi:hypothetical protein